MGRVANPPQQKWNISRGMTWMSRILILSYRLKEVTISYVLHSFLTSKNVHILATRCPIEIGFGSKCCILIGQVTYTEISKLNIADMWLVPLNNVTNYMRLAFSPLYEWVWRLYMGINISTLFSLFIYSHGYFPQTKNSVSIMSDIKYANWRHIHSQKGIKFSGIWP